MFYIVCNMNWFDIWNKNAKRDIELHKRNGYNFLSEEQYNKIKQLVSMILEGLQ